MIILTPIELEILLVGKKKKKKSPRAELPWFAARKQQLSPLLWLWSTVIC
jgi:hypothetical protein